MADRIALYVEGGTNELDDADKAIEHHFETIRQREARARNERARVAAIIAAGTQDDNEAPAEWF